MRTVEFDFSLPPELIAQAPMRERDASRLLVLDRAGKSTTHRHFTGLLDYLNPGDVLVLNDSRVIPARLRGRNASTGGKFEVLLLEENATNDWWAMLRPGKRGQPGVKIELLDKNGQSTPWTAIVREINGAGHRRLQFTGGADVLTALETLGEAPLPPYIERAVYCQEDRDRYQTVYARAAGSVAAPTAGLHFTPEFLGKIRERGVKTCFITLHVGAGTFAPVKSDLVSEHHMHEERFAIGTETARLINEARGAVAAVGTTTLRALESVARANEGRVVAGTGRTGIFIYPPFHFKIVDKLVTNFHLPCSTLLMLAGAFAAPGETGGSAVLLAAYQEAIAARYRFFSYGDAMLIV